MEHTIDAETEELDMTKKHSRSKIMLAWALLLTLVLFSCANAAVKGYQEQLAAMSDDELLTL